MPANKTKPWTRNDPTDGHHPTVFLGFRLETTKTFARDVSAGQPGPGVPADGGGRVGPTVKTRRILIQYWSDGFWRDVPDIMERL